MTFESKQDSTEIELELFEKYKNPIFSVNIRVHQLKLKVSKHFLLSTKQTTSRQDHKKALEFHVNNLAFILCEQFYLCSRNHLMKREF